MKLVLDASVTLAWCLPDERSDYAQIILNHGHLEFMVPSLWYLEVTYGLGAAFRRGRIDHNLRQGLWREVVGLPCDVFVGEWPKHIERIDGLALEHGLAPYDAWYLMLALKLDAPLATLDEKLAEAARKTNCLYG